MSASADLQAAVQAKLQATFNATVGDGVATSFLLTHNFGTQFLYLLVKSGNTELINGTDYGVALTDQNSITITALNGAPGHNAWTVRLALLRSPNGVAIPVVKRRTKELAAEIAAATANNGLALFVMPPLPTSATQGDPFVFFSGAEVRVRIVEKPAISARYGCDAYDLLDDVAVALHWQSFSSILQVPLQIAERPVEMVEDPTIRIIDVIFTAVYGLQPATTNS